MNKTLALRPTWQRFALVALLTLSLLPPSVLGWQEQAVAPAKIATLSVAEQEAAAEKSRITEQTEFEINKLREQAIGEIERKNQLARLELRRFSAEESIRLAEEKIRREINPEKDARLVRANIESIGGLN